MLKNWKVVSFAGLIFVIYSLLFYFQITMQLRVDFSSFYAAALAYSNNINPFQDLISSFLIIPNKLPANLNPPVFLQLISPIIHLPFLSALSLWFLLSLVLNICGCLLSFYLIVPKPYFQKNWFLFVLIYFAMFSTIMNANIGQLGGLLLFFVMTGYYFFLKKNDYGAGILWGFIIAIKFFPGLLFIFALVQKRYKLFFIMLLTSVSVTLLPLLSKGTDIYTLYIQLLPQVMWYGCSWNGSIYGFLFRILVDTDTLQNLMSVRLLYYSIFILLLYWYTRKLFLFRNKEATHYAFSFTLVMMLLLSPFGWMYYFSLLIMPLTLIWQSVNKYAPTNFNSILWTLSLFLINFPNGNVQEQFMDYSLYKLTIYSVYFYGLLAVLYLLLKLFATQESLSNKELRIHSSVKGYLFTLQITLGFGLFIVLSNFTLFNL